MDRTKWHRRQFIRGATAAAGTAGLMNACSRRESAWRFLTEEEAKLLGLVCEQIIPADQDPGAIEAGVVNFIDKQLVGPHSRFQQAYRTGLAAIEKTSQAMFGAAFGALKWEEQTRILQAMESGKVPDDIWKSIGSRELFGTVRDHTMQGFYGSPRHGGNRKYVSYRMLGVEYPQILGQNRYRKS